jgi:hypothetical protein
VEQWNVFHGLERGRLRAKRSGGAAGVVSRLSTSCEQSHLFRVRKDQAAKISYILRSRLIAHRFPLPVLISPLGQIWAHPLFSPALTISLPSRQIKRIASKTGESSQDVQGHTREHLSLSLRSSASVSLLAEQSVHMGLAGRWTHRRHSAQLKLCLEPFSFSFTPAALGAIDGLLDSPSVGVGWGGGSMVGSSAEVTISMLEGTQLVGLGRGEVVYHFAG